MTEAEWLAGTSQPAAMLRYACRHARRRKMILLGCGCCRLVWDHLGPADRAAVEAAERAADGVELTPPGPTAAISDPPDGGVGESVSNAAHNVVWAATHSDLWGGLDRAVGWALTAAARTVGPGELKAALARRRGELCDLFREVVGNPFRPWKVVPTALGGGIIQPDGKKIFVPPAVRDLSICLHAGRAFDRLPVLADAAEECGITDESLLFHLRHDRPHAPGCWAADLLSGRS